MFIHLLIQIFDDIVKFKRRTTIVIPCEKKWIENICYGISGQGEAYSWGVSAWTAYDSKKKINYNLKFYKKPDLKIITVTRNKGKNVKCVVKKIQTKFVGKQLSFIFFVKSIN